ncbi:uncharacterized protein LOC113926800 [Zalophus californianus]|uniref:Uncharacterized protein LOC112838095 n=2 Tax=Otariidae TaxID=9702 RepID=A0A3Q7QJK6_CALUR|nr:uncharacterized protein LOC112838095 [Callorhinus ursinus]XP_027457928.1 uncharacterized protein LOC113926800 [Zalophus californianus]
MSRENHQPTEPLHPRCSAHCDRAARAAAAAQPPPGTHSLARRPGRRRREGRGGGGEDEKEEKRGRKRGRIGTGGGGGGEEGEGSPALRGLSAKQTPQKKVISVQASALESFFPPRSGSGSQQGRSRRPGGGKPKRRVSVRGGTASLPQPLAAETAAASGASRVRGRVAFEKGSENKQLKMAATAAASHAPQRHRPELSAAAHRAGRHHLRRTRGRGGWRRKVFRAGQAERKDGQGERA